MIGSKPTGEKIITSDEYERQCKERTMSQAWVRGANVEMFAECIDFANLKNPLVEPCVHGHAFDMPEYDASPHQYFIKNLLVLRCIATCARCERQVISFRVYTPKGERNEAAEKELSLKSRVQWVEDMSC